MGNLENDKVINSTLLHLGTLKGQTHTKWTRKLERNLLPKLTMSRREMQSANIFAEITGSLPKLCIFDQMKRRIIFIANPSEMGRIIGKGGRTLYKLQDKFRKDIKLIEFAETAERLTANALRGLAGVKIQAAQLDIDAQNGKKVALVTVASRDKGRLIGRNGRNINPAKRILRHYHGIQDITIQCRREIRLLQ